jgi:hypothetical protein
MIEHIFQLLRFAPTGKSELIDTAKGKYKYPETFKEILNYIKWQLQKK